MRLSLITTQFVANVMDEALNIEALVSELLAEFGQNASSEAEKRMNAAMESGDVKEAGVWLSVMYEISKKAAPDTLH